MNIRTVLAGGASLACLSLSCVAMAQVPAPSPQPTQDDEVVGQEIVVIGIRGSLANAQAIKREAASVVEAIAPQDLGKFTDPSIADAFQRVPGVQIQRSDNGTAGERASIRGLGPAYVMVTVNGRQPLSYGSEGINNLRSFNLDSIPSEIISGALIYKSPTADLVETGLAGGVELQTLKPLDYKPIDGGNIFGSVTGSLRRDNVNTDTAPRLSGVVGAKLLDDTLGVYASAIWSKANNRVEALASSPVYANINVRNAQGGVDVVNDVLYPAFSGNTLLGEVKRAAFSGGLQWRPSSSLELNLDYSYDHYDRPSLRMTHLINIAGANGALRRSIFEPGSITIKDGTITSIDFSKITPPADGGNPNNIKTGYDTRSFFYNNDSTSQQLGANLAYKTDNFTLKGDASYSDLRARQQLFAMGGGVYWFPTNNGVIYNNPDGKNPTVSMPPSANIFNAQNYVLPSTSGRIFQNRAENYAFRLDGDWEAKDDLHLQFGARMTNTLVDVRAGNAGLSLTAPQQAAALPVVYTGEIEHNRTTNVLGIESFPVRSIAALRSQLPSLVLSDTPDRVPFTGPFASANDPTAPLPLDVNNSYRVREKTLAFYGQLANKGMLGDLEYSGNLGVRAVRTQDQALAFQGVRTIDQATNAQISSVATPIQTESSYWNILPSANLSLYPADAWTIRLSAAKTMSRPEFEQLSPINAITLADPSRPLYNPALNDTARIGNPDLKPITAWNFDATLEFYPVGGGAYYASAFYKDVKNFIFYGLIRNMSLPGFTRPFDVTTATNAANGRAYGFELGLNQPFGFLGDALSNFGLQANFTYVDSKFDTANILLQSGIPGASKYNANAMLYYEDKRFQARASYVYRGDYLAALGNGQDRNQLPTFTRAAGSLDASISYKFLSNFEVILTGTNLTKADRYDYIYTKSTFREHDVRPRAFTLAGRVTF